MVDRAPLFNLFTEIILFLGLLVELALFAVIHTSFQLDAKESQ